MKKAIKTKAKENVKFELATPVGFGLLLATLVGHYVYIHFFVDDPSGWTSFGFGMMLMILWLPIFLIAGALYAVGRVYRKRNVRVTSAMNLALLVVSVIPLIYLTWNTVATNQTYDTMYEENALDIY